MARTTSALPPGKSRAVLPATVTLAAWRVRQTWRLLLVTGLGMLAGVTLVCAAPLFSQVTLTAGLRSVLTATPQAAEVTIRAEAKQLAPDTVAQTNQALDHFMQGLVGPYLSGAPQFSIQPKPLHVSSFRSGDQLSLIGGDMQESSTHVQILAGRLPQRVSDEIEIAVTPATYNALHTTLGATFTTTIGFLGPEGPIGKELTLRLVGTFMPASGDEFWHGETFEPASLGEFTEYKALMSDYSFLAALNTGEQFLDKPNLLWYYHLNVAHIRMADLDNLIAELNTAQIQITQQFSTSDVLGAVQLFGPSVESFGVPSNLERYRDRVSVVQIPVDIVAFQVFCLVLFFVSMVADLLIERQAEVMSLLRSRGASRWQVFGSFVNQSVGLGVIVLIAGPLLAILVTRLIAQATLSPADQGALNSIEGNPFQVALSVGWYALIASLGAVVAMILAIRSSASRDVLEMRREAARATRPPLWQRLFLDVVAAIIALTAFVISLYVSHAGIADARVNLLIAAPLALIAPVFLVVAGVLFFLRFFPVLMRRSARLAARRAGAVPMLALAQMARAPRRAIRMVLLLALATSFALFALTFTASESQQILNVAGQQTGADFSGPTPNFTVQGVDPHQTLAQRTAMYLKVPGVTSATLGFVDSASPVGGASTIPLAIRAVDTKTFAQTAIWTEQDSSTSITSLTSELATSKATGIPAIVDALAWNELHLSAGATFTLSLGDSSLIFVVIGEVQHIPTVNDSLDVPGTSDYTPPGGILVDYARLTTVYHDFTKGNLALNYVWLRTSDDPALLKKIRAALSAGPLQLASFNDRRAIIANLERDPLYVNLIAILRLGAVVTVLLALLGNMIASWLSASRRLINFGVLRALGSAPRQIASVLVWEQGIVYAAAMLLGVLFGALLIAAIVPALVFVGAPDAGTTMSSGEFYVIQHVLPVQIILPPSLGLVFVGIVLVCAVALWMMARVVSKPGIGQTLRLNED
jgi:hypothetical protein